MDLDVHDVAQAAHTGAPPGPTEIDHILERAFARAARHTEGAVADYIPVLAQADPEVDLDSPNFVSNDRLEEILAETDASPDQVAAAVALNEEARLAALRLGLLILAGVSAVAILPASRLPSYRPHEIPDPAEPAEESAPTRPGSESQSEA